MRDLPTNYRYQVNREQIGEKGYWYITSMDIIDQTTGKIVHRVYSRKLIDRLVMNAKQVVHPQRLINKIINLSMLEQQSAEDLI